MEYGVYYEPFTTGVKTLTLVWSVLAYTASPNVTMTITVVIIPKTCMVLVCRFYVTYVFDHLLL